MEHLRRAPGSVALVLVIWLGAACSASNNASTPTSNKPPISATIPPNYTGPIGSDRSGQGATGTTSGSAAIVPTSVLPENQAFCEALQKTSGLFSGPANGADDAEALRQVKETFANLVDLAPASIKPEVQGMNNTIQSLSAVSDLDRLNDPTFTANQERFAEFVLQNCGFELVG